MTTEVVSGVTEKVLTHEVGAGAPCLKCGNKCPGLDLHFWRKICRNCKCKQEDHDVQAEISTRGIENIGKLLMHDQGQVTEKAPTSHHSSPDKSQAPVNGHVNAVSTSKTQSVTTPETQTTKSQVSPGDSLHFTIDIGGQKHELDFGGNSDAAHREKSHPYATSYHSSTTTSDLPPPPVPDVPTSIKLSRDAPPPPPAYPASPDLPPPPIDMQFNQAEDTPPVPPLPQEYEQKLKLDSPQKYTTTVTITTNKQIPPAPSNDRRGSSSSSSGAAGESDRSDTGSEISYDWKPPVQNDKLAVEYIASLPKEKQPIRGTEGGQYRRKQLMRQLPPHDQEPGACHDLTPQEKQEMDVFVTQYREKALGAGVVNEAGKIKTCVHCDEILKIGDVMVIAERAGADKYWHPKCFVCTECKELLVDLIYFYHDGKIYCGRHYCELHKPRCAACDELIFAPEYTQAEDCYWHLKHFCCWQCDQPLGGKNYVPHENQPVCIPCYEKSFAHKCATCKQVIAPNIEWVTFQEHHWHALPVCFKCSNCDQSLVGKPCIPKGEMVFCSSKCKKEKIPPQ